MDPACPLCQPDDLPVVYRGPSFRVVDAATPGLPGYLRLIWSSHVAEMSDLTEGERDLLARALLAIERTVRDTMAPDKINLAQLGNMVPHLHWHVIPRWRDDPWFPDSVWAPPRRPLTTPAARREAGRRLLAALPAALDSLGRPPRKE